MVKHYRQIASSLDRKIGAALRQRGLGQGKGGTVVSGGEKGAQAAAARDAHPLAFPVRLRASLAPLMHNIIIVALNSCTTSLSWL